MRSPRTAILPFVMMATFPGAGAGQVITETEQLGSVDFETSCPEVTRAPFSRAVALLHHMTYEGARAAFAEIAAAHPTCAMAHWGIAMTLFQPLWPTRPSEDDLRRGWQAVERARTIHSTTPRERMFIDAVAAFFDPDRAEYWQRIAGWAEASRVLHDAYPEDLEAKAFYALSQLATAPPSGDLSHHAAAATALVDILRRQPKHPGAIHYTVHASDATGREHESMDVVQRYAETAPLNPHALHMPTHIFVRVGKWSDVIDGNRRAAEAALAHPAGDHQQWVWDEYPHAIEYLVYALLQVGDDREALESMRRLERTADLQPTFKTAFHLASIPARYALERRDWTRAAKLEPRPNPALAWDQFPWPEAVTWFARGMGSLRTGDIDAARSAEVRLQQLKRDSERLGEALFARHTEIMRLELSAWLAHSAADGEAAIRLLREAVTLEANTPKPPVTPAPTLPALELLGDLFLEMERPADALDAYESSLQIEPNRFNTLVGAARAARRNGDLARASDYYRALRDVAIIGSPREELKEAAAFLRANRSELPER